MPEEKRNHLQELHDVLRDHPMPEIPVTICSQCHTGLMVKRFIGREAVVMREYYTRDEEDYSQRVPGTILLHDTCVVDYLTEHTSTSLQAVSP